jgi:uncharacterized protein (DUF2164 family)
MTIKISDERKAQLVAELRAFHVREFDEDISSFRAEQLIDFYLQKLGPGVYNQAVQDARAYIQTRLDELEGDVYLKDVV